MEAMELNLNEIKMVTGGVTAEEVEDHIYGTVVGAGAGYVTGLTTGTAIGFVVGGGPGAVTGAQIGGVTGALGGAVAGGVMGLEKFCSTADNLLRKFVSLF